MRRSVDREARRSPRVPALLWDVAAREHTVDGPGGRTLRVREDGDPDGVPLIAHHGTPGSRLLYERWVEDAAERGIRLIAYDRAGYGGSDRDAGRRSPTSPPTSRRSPTGSASSASSSTARRAAARTRSPAPRCSAIAWPPPRRSARSPPTTPRGSTSWPGMGEDNVQRVRRRASRGPRALGAAARGARARTARRDPASWPSALRRCSARPTSPSSTAASPRS